jgi:O-acetyl-ADP-ribose deacetylase (regulator of RNase III)
VNSVKPNLDLSQGVLSQAILKAAGPGIQAECSNSYPGGLPSGQMVATSGGNMRGVQRIFHVVLNKWDGDQGRSEQVNTYYLCRHINDCWRNNDVSFAQHRTQSCNTNVLNTFSLQT